MAISISRIKIPFLSLRIWCILKHLPPFSYCLSISPSVPQLPIHGPNPSLLTFTAAQGDYSELINQ